MQDEIKVAKFIVFKIGEYLLALPISEVLKVVKCSTVANTGLRMMGLVQLGRHTIRVLELHQYLNVETPNFTSLPSSNLAQPFLVITRDPQGELCGIGVEEAPDLIEIPLETMQSLPKPDRHSKGVLEIASHAAVLSQKDGTTTIFLLDLKRFLNNAVADSYPPALRPA
jgi:purine-binding chemotaxis protein CheW